MKKMLKSIAILLSLATAVNTGTFTYQKPFSTAKAASSATVVEKLGRGISAINTGKGMMVS